MQTSNQPTNPIKTFENFYMLFVKHKKYDKKAFAPFGVARSACIPPPQAALSCCYRNKFSPPLRGDFPAASAAKKRKFHRLCRLRGIPPPKG